MITIKRRRALATVFILFIAVSLNGQITIIDTLDIQAGLNSQSISASVEPVSLSSSVQKLFDGNKFSVLSGNVDSIRVTLVFNEATEITRSKVYFPMIPGEWSLEIAASENDMMSMSGSYSKLVNDKSYAANKEDSVLIDTSVKVIRLTARNLSLNWVYIGEWYLTVDKTITSMVILPFPPKLTPGSKLKLKASVITDDSTLYSYPIGEPLIWSSGNPAAADFLDENSTLSGIAVGTSEITVRNQSNTLSGTAVANVMADFQPALAAKKIVKVAVVYQNPMVGMGQKLHQKFGWADPTILVAQLQQEFKNASSGVVEFQLTEIYDDQILFTRLDSVFLTVNQLVTYYNEPGWSTLKLAHQQGRLKFDYRELINHYDFCTKRDQGIIDEVWVYAHPYASMYESQLVGQNAFWWNSPPIKDAGCVKLLSIMGLNYERGIPEAMESFGHRMESALWHAFGRWNNAAPDPNNWEIFTKIDKDFPGEAQVGNIHFPPNGLSDYDFGNPRKVDSYSDDWSKFPYLLNKKRNFGCEEWGCSHLGYMRWWYRHLPRFAGVTDGILNNWWHYWLDPEEAEQLAAVTPVVKVEELKTGFIPGEYLLEQNYPNPFNPETSINFSLPKRSFVSLRIYDLLGKEAATLVNDELFEGNYSVKFSAKNFASGVYFYTIEAVPASGGRGFIESKKMVLVK